MALRLVFVVLLISGVSYWHLTSQLASDTEAQLLGYITERGQREETIFLLAEDNHKLLHQEFLQQFTALTPKSWQQDFAQKFFQWPDRTVRNVPEGTSPEDFDTQHHTTAFVQPDVDLTEDFQARLTLADDLVGQYGLGWQTSFVNTYISLPEGAFSVYIPGLSYGISAPADYDLRAAEWFHLGSKAHNPERRTLWTGVYLDPVMNEWVVSAATPIDDENQRHLGTIGHDIGLNDLIERVMDDHLEGAYNLLMRTDGQLIAEPNLMDRIQTEAGKLTVQTAGDPHLQRIFEFTQQAGQANDVLYNRHDHEFLAISRIQGPDWYLVTVYPEQLLQDQAISNTRFLLILGLSSLGLEILLLNIVLRRQIVSPLQALLGATQQVTAGNLDVTLESDRQDELGQLTTAFTHMTQQLQVAFTDLEEKITEQKQAEAIILEKTRALEQALQDLQHMQLQTIQSEKMAALGNLVAGVAHEINNPVGCILGNVGATKAYISDLLGLLDLYAQACPDPGEEIEDELETVDLEYVREDLPKLIRAMKDSGDRITSISKSLRTFSRADTDNKQSFDLHEGIESTVLILRHRLKANEQRPAIEVITDYSEIPAIDCFPGQLNQVFMNILANAIDALDEASQNRSFDEMTAHPPRITIQTSMENEHVKIAIADNGPGMPETVKGRIFDHLFTTKAVGQGTGLGLAIAQQIIVEAHGGTIEVASEPGQGTELSIQLPYVSGPTNAQAN